MTLIPEGTWRARGVTAALGYTRDGNEQIGVELAFSPEQDVDVDGRHLTWYGSFANEKSEAFTFKALRALGWASDDISDLAGIDANEIEAVVIHEDDLQGEPRARVRYINPIGSGGVAMKTKMTAEQASAFAERMRGRVMAMSRAAAPPPTAAGKRPAPAAARDPNRGNRAAAQSAAAAAVQPPEDDNIPF